MTLNDIVQQTIESQLRQADVEAFREQEQITTEVFCDEFARHVAIGYVDGRLNYESADSAIAGLFFHFSPFVSVPEFASSVFNCFDEGEYQRTQGHNGDEIARHLVRKLLDHNHE